MASREEAILISDDESGQPEQPTHTLPDPGSSTGNGAQENPLLTSSINQGPQRPQPQSNLDRPFDSLSADEVLQLVSVVTYGEIVNVSQAFRDRREVSWSDVADRVAQAVREVAAQRGVGVEQIAGELARRQTISGVLKRDMQQIQRQTEASAPTLGVQPSVAQPRVVQPSLTQFRPLAPALPQPRPPESALPQPPSPAREDGQSLIEPEEQVVTRE